MENQVISAEKELFYDALIEQIKLSVPDTKEECTQFLNMLTTLLQENESEVSFKAKINILHMLAMYCGSYWITLLPYPSELEA